MSISATVQQTIERIPPGEIFGYDVFADFATAPGAVVKALSRVVSAQRVKRLAKGRFYIPKEGLLGPMGVSDDALLRVVLYYRGQRCGYVTGPALYNRLGLTTQVPKTITVATNRSAQTKDFGTLRIKLVVQRAPINNSTIPLLEILDTLRDAKRVPDTKADRVILAMERQIDQLETTDIKKLQTLAVDYYNAATRALLGMIIERLDQSIVRALRASINPTSTFRIGLSANKWANARQWNVQ